MFKKGHDSHSDSHGHSHSHSDSHGHGGHSHGHSHNNNDCPCFPADCDCDVAVIGINQGTGRVDFFDLAPNDAALNNCTITTGTPGNPQSATLAADAFRCLCLSGFRFAFSFGPPGNERLVFIRCD